MCDRHYGVGGDGVIFAMNSELHPELDSAAEKGAADYKMVIYNSDGEGGVGGLQGLVLCLHTRDLRTTCLMPHIHSLPPWLSQSFFSLLDIHL
jgi:hypothetical protein